MSLLLADKLVRDFTTYETSSGLSGAIKALFVGRPKRLLRAVDSFSFEVGAGEILGLIGPNGAGKSTIVKLAVGILPPSAGSIRLFGLDPFAHRLEVSRSYGVVFGQRSQLWWNLSPREAFTALAEIYELEPAAAAQQIDYLSGVLELRDFLKRPVRQLSLGQRVRCDIAAALLHQPKLIFLDEPTVGVDVLGKERLRSFIRQINHERGVSILLTSHDMLDIERLCHRVLVIDKGQLVFAGQLDELRKRFCSQRQMVIDLVDAPASLTLSAAEIVKKDSEQLVLRFDPQAQSAMSILEQVSGQCEIRDFSLNDMPIDEVIGRIYREARPRTAGAESPVLEQQK